MDVKIIIKEQVTPGYNPNVSFVKIDNIRYGMMRNQIVEKEKIKEIFNDLKKKSTKGSLKDSETHVVMWKAEINNRAFLYMGIAVRGGKRLQFSVEKLDLINMKNIRIILKGDVINV